MWRMIYIHAGERDTDGLYEATVVYNERTDMKRNETKRSDKKGNHKKGGKSRGLLLLLLPSLELYYMRIW